MYNKELVFNKPSTVNSTNSNGWRLVGFLDGVEVGRITCNGETHFLHYQGQVWQRFSHETLKIMVGHDVSRTLQKDVRREIEWKEYGGEYADD